MRPRTPPRNGSVRKRTAAPPPPPPRRYRSMAEVMRAAEAAPPLTGDYYADVRCEQCRSGDRDEEILLCDRCDRGYHLFCLRPIVVRVPSNPWFCPSCAEEKPSQNGKKRRKRSLVMYKKRRRILPFVPTDNPAQRLKQMGSLASALTSLQMEFSNELTYMPGMAPRSSNLAILEKGGMQVLSREDKETLDLCRTMHKRGECPPLLVVFDSREGFTVQADGNIKDMTLISEYTGDVDYLKNRDHDDCDSMMTLLLAENPSDSLVICPDKRGNIARFINGINNHTPRIPLPPSPVESQSLSCSKWPICFAEREGRSRTSSVSGTM